MSDSQTELKRTILHSTHTSLGARMVPFGGWDMPIQYTSILEEAKAVRNAAGIFDVSHMGRVMVTGKGAGAFIGSVFSSDVTKLKVGRAKYGVTCNEEGGIIDDNIVYRLGEDEYLYIPNAGNRDAVGNWLHKHAAGRSNVRIEDVSEQLAMIALQGPGAADILASLSDIDVPAMRFFSIVTGKVAGVEMMIARTGYTGEDGFEVMPPSDKAAEVWEAFAEKGAKPAGLGARDVLRLEAGLPLHGNDIDLTTDPYEAGLGKFVDPEREGYVPGKALRAIADRKPTRVLAGFKMVERGIPRHGYDITDGSAKIGTVTSGGVSPTLDLNIGMGYVPLASCAYGSKVYVDVRGRQTAAEIVPLPFYKRSKS